MAGRLGRGLLDTHSFRRHLLHYIPFKKHLIFTLKGLLNRLCNILQISGVAILTPCLLCLLSYLGLRIVLGGKHCYYPCFIEKEAAPLTPFVLCAHTQTWNCSVLGPHGLLQTGLFMIVHWDPSTRFISLFPPSSAFGFLFSVCFFF